MTTRVVIDASALAAVVFGEPHAEAVVARIDGTTVFAPDLLKFEMINTAWKKVRRQPADAVKIFTALSFALNDDANIVWHDVDPTAVALVAYATGLTAYDASYLWLAGSLGVDLVTLDARIAAASALIDI